jgi:hypothetical protein
MPLRKAFLAAALAAAPVLPPGPSVETRAPDIARELAAFVDRAAPPAYGAEVVNAYYGEALLGSHERREGWLSDPANWRLLDAVDRAHNLSTHDWLARRGIRADFYGYNEYQETIHFDERAALALLGERGLARGALGELVRDPEHNQDVVAWRALARGDAWIADPLEPRWAQILRYDMLTSPLFADGISQDNLGAPLSRMGPAALGRFGDAASRGFAAWLSGRGEAPQPPIRADLRARLWGAFATLPPYAPSVDADRLAISRAAQSLCADPRMAEYQLYLHAANLHAFARHYTDLRRVAARDGRAFDVHGNMGGGIIGASAYPIALGEIVDSLWFESSGVAEYDQIERGWWNAYGSLRLVLAEAIARGRKPAYFPVGSTRQSADLLALDLAEVSAGGGVPLVSPDALAADAPALVPTIDAFLRLRDGERAFFAPKGRARSADVALLYSLPTFVFDPCVPGASSTDSPPLNDLSGAARALEQGHIPYDALVLGHADLGGDRATLAALRSHALVIAPSVGNLSESQISLLERYLRDGGKLGVLGRVGVRDERNRPRAADVAARLRAAGDVRTLLGGASFPPTRQVDGAQTKTKAARFLEEISAALPDPGIAGPLPPTLWVKTWRHAGGRFSAHFVNYAIDRSTREAQPTAPVVIRLLLPPYVKAGTARWLEPGKPARSVAVVSRGGSHELELPSIRVYGVLAFGSPTPARADGRVADAARSERAYLDEIRSLADIGAPVLALRFGQAEMSAPWRSLAADTRYQADRGYGWLESDDDSAPTPEESAYRDAAGVASDALREVPLLGPFWPFAPEALPVPFQRALVSGRAQRLRLDLADGLYRVNIVTVNGAWNQRNFLVSGMVRADERTVLLDLPLNRGGLARRSFSARASGGKLELRLGGPTGFGVAALWVERADAPDVDPLERGALREWTISARHANPDWVELEDVIPPLGAPGQAVHAAASGIPVVDLGTLAGARIGDVVVARTRIERDSGGTATLRVGASSAAHVYLNGQRVLVVPNVKGVERDEGLATVPLRAGANELELVLGRFWERRWMFYASVD